MSEKKGGREQSTSSSHVMIQGLTEALQRTEASLLPSIMAQQEGTAAAGLDFLQVKNSMVLSYLIELTHDLRQRLLHDEYDNDETLSLRRDRLEFSKTVLDKSRGLDKKLRYQIDKLLAAGSTASTFASGNENEQEDPLQFRPDLRAMDDEEEEGEESADDNDDDDNDASDSQDDGDEDEELAAARMTVAKSRGSSKKKKSAHDDDDNDEDEGTPGVYRAPRLTAVPYTHDKKDVQAERERRQRRKMRASELAQTLRAQYGEAPEQEDTRGGAELGRQREAARRMAEREKEKERYEEDNMVRLTTSRKEKKERKRLMREENSNLAAIADLGNLVRESQFGERKQSTDDHEDIFESKRHSNGKRKKQLIDGDGKLLSGKGRKSMGAKNALQEALFGGSGSGGGGKKKGKKRKSY